MTDGAKVWFITGIGRGLGRTLAEEVLSAGDIVIGTVRSDVLLPDDKNLHVVRMDVTQPESVTAAVASAMAMHSRIDVVVNNAGYGLLGSVEEADEAEIAHLFDVDFHGVHRVVRAILPHLRVQRAGHILNITSIAGLAPAAGSGFYAAVKFAVAGLSQSLAKELAPIGVKVTLVEPGAFRTEFLSERSIRVSQSRIDDYEPTVGVVLKNLAKMAGRQPGDPQAAARAMIEIVRSEAPPLHLVLGSDALRRARDHLAETAADFDLWEATSLSTDFSQTDRA